MSELHKNYVLGLMFDSVGRRVALICKNKPEWQKDKLNGVGGKIERGELAVKAMCREFEEETGVHTEESQWQMFCRLGGRGFNVFVYRAFSDAAVDSARTVTDEPVGVYDARGTSLRSGSIVSNLAWLIPMALDPNDGFMFFAAVDYDRSETIPNHP